MYYFKYFVMVFGVLLMFSCEKQEPMPVCQAEKTALLLSNRYLSSFYKRQDSLFYYFDFNGVYQYNSLENKVIQVPEEGQFFDFKTIDNVNYFDADDHFIYHKKGNELPNVLYKSIEEIISIFPGIGTTVFAFVLKNNRIEIQKYSVSTNVQIVDYIPIPNLAFFKFSDTHSFTIDGNQYFSFIIPTINNKGVISHKYSILDITNGIFKISDPLDSNDKFLGQLFSVDQHVFVTMLKNNRNLVVEINPINGETMVKSFDTGIPARVELNQFLIVENGLSLQVVSLKDGSFSPEMMNIANIYDLIMVNKDMLIVREDKVSGTAKVFDIKTGCLLYTLPGYELYFEDGYLLKSNNLLVLRGLSNTIYRYQL